MVIVVGLMTGGCCELTCEEDSGLCTEGDDDDEEDGSFDTDAEEDGLLDGRELEPVPESQATRLAKHIRASKIHISRFIVNPLLSSFDKHNFPNYRIFYHFIFNLATTKRLQLCNKLLIDLFWEMLYYKIKTEKDVYFS